MTAFDRRAFLGLSVGAISVLRTPGSAFAQATCVTSGLAPFLPASLTVDCASRRNFANFKKNSAYMGLAGAVSMTTLQGKYGVYSAGNLFLFPWLKPKGQALGMAKDWQTVMPTSATNIMTAKPIPNWRLPLDEYFLRYILQAPWGSFIGFRVDVPFNLQDSRRAWFTNVDTPAVGIGWNSSNLNAPWFAGSTWIPPSDPCNGNAWRALIVNGVKLAASAIC